MILRGLSKTCYFTTLHSPSLQRSPHPGGGEAIITHTWWTPLHWPAPGLCVHRTYLWGPSKRPSSVPSSLLPFLLNVPQNRDTPLREAPEPPPQVPAHGSQNQKHWEILLKMPSLGPHHGPMTSSLCRRAAEPSFKKASAHTAPGPALCAARSWGQSH